MEQAGANTIGKSTPGLAGDAVGYSRQEMLVALDLLPHRPHIHHTSTSIVLHVFSAHPFSLPLHLRGY